jgi:hypothetical protein
LFLKFVGQKRKGINPEFIHSPPFSRSVELFFTLAGLLTRSVFEAFPSVVVGQWQYKFKNLFKSLQQRELSGIFTRFPFNPPIGETIVAQK